MNILTIIRRKALKAQAKYKALRAQFLKSRRDHRLTFCNYAQRTPAMNRHSNGPLIRDT